jgi:hypothetical protein
LAWHLVASPRPEVKKETSVAEGSAGAKKISAVADKQHEAEPSATTTTSTETSTSKAKKRKSVLGRIVQHFKE